MHTRTHSIASRPSVLLPLIIATVMASWAAGGCTRRPLYVYGSDRGLVQAGISWSGSSESPTGMTFMLFLSDTLSGRVESDISNDIQAVCMRLPLGTYQCYVFSHTPAEYGSLTFSSLSDFDLARVSLSPESPMPEAISAAAGSFSVTREIIEASRDYVLWERGMPGVMEEVPSSTTRSSTSSSSSPFTTKSDAYPVITLSPSDITSSLTIRVYIRNIESLRSISGAISGMAEGHYLTRPSTTPESITQPLSAWSMHRSASNYTDGYIETTISTFGLPSTDTGPSTGTRASTSDRAPSANILTVFLQLRDGSSLAPLEFPVGDLFEISESGPSGPRSIRLSLTIGATDDTAISLPDTEPTDPEHTGAFDPGVDEWDSGGDPIEIPV